MNRLWQPVAAAAGVFLLDRISKSVVRAMLPLGAEIPLVPGLSLTHVTNRGVAFSLFADADGPWHLLLLVFGTMATGVVLYMMIASRDAALWERICWGFIAGGALGNLVDRILMGEVVDFIRLWVRVGGRYWSWPDFNVADMAITCGAAVLVVRYVMEGVRAPRSDTDR